MRDIVYVARDRLEFTQISFGWLLETTNWECFNRLYVYDDGSTDGTREWLEDAVRACPQEHYFVRCHYHSPIGVMNAHVDKTDAEWFCKVDNDILLPHGWSEAMCSVIDSHDIDFLGMEAGMSGQPEDGWDGGYGPNWDCSHIGGVGLMRVGAIKRYPRPVPNGRFGWTESQHKFKRKMAWISPDLRMACLDKIPDEPFPSLSSQYVDRGIQRRWHPYPKEMQEFYWGWIL